MKSEETLQVTQMVRIGTLMFEMNCFNAIYTVFDNYINDICVKKDWKIYIDPYWLQVLRAMKQAYPQSIDIKIIEIQFLPHQPSILFSLSFPKFQSLKKLSLDNVRIHNIQSLIFIDAQNIHQLNLSSNIITSFYSINKINWPKLNLLTIKGNKSPQINFYRAKFANYFLSLNLDVSYNIMQVQDLSTLMKLESLRFESIDLSMSNFVIFNPRIRNKLVQKAQTFVIFWGNMFESFRDNDANRGMEIVRNIGANLI